MNEKALKTLRYLLMALFVSYYCGSTLFVHTHTFDWGTITHSHPYMPTGGGHSHTAAECVTIASLTTLLFTIVGAISVVLAVRCVTLFHTPCSKSAARHLLENASLRAPPVSIC